MLALSLVALIACGRGERNETRIAATVSSAKPAPIGAVLDGAHVELPHLPNVPDGMVRVDAGFVADCWSYDDHAEGDCSRTIAVSAFYLDGAETTVNAYAECVDAGQCEAPGLKAVDQRWLCTWVKREQRGSAPMNCIGVEEARAFCAWRAKRLPEPREWLRALRLLHPNPYLWEGGPMDVVKTFALGPCWGQSAPCDVPHWRPSNGGASDLVGNVSEWASSNGSARAMGLSWADPDPHDMTLLRVDRSVAVREGARSFRIGIRCARSDEAR